MYAVILVGVLLIALSAVADAATTDAAPVLYGGVVVLVAGASIAGFAGFSQRLLLASSICLFNGGFAGIAVGLATLDARPAVPWLELVGDAALLAGVAGVLYWWYG